MILFHPDMQFGYGINNFEVTESPLKGKPTGQRRSIGKDKKKQRVQNLLTQISKRSLRRISELWGYQVVVCIQSYGTT